MRTLKFLTVCALCAMVVASCGNKMVGEKLPGIPDSQLDSVSYAIGLSFGYILKQNNIPSVNMAEVEKAIVDVVSGNETKLQMDDIDKVISKYMIDASQAMLDVKTKEQADFFAKNRGAEGVQETESGLQYKIVEPGNSEVMAAATDTVEVHYTGTLLDGTVFDSSVERGESIKFPLNRVIKGWTEGMQLVGEGGKIKLWVPFDLGYGPRAVSPQLPGYSTLVFDVELIKVYKAEPVEEEKK